MFEHGRMKNTSYNWCNSCCCYYCGLLSSLFQADNFKIIDRTGKRWKKSKIYIVHKYQTDMRLSLFPLHSTHACFLFIIDIFIRKYCRSENFNFESKSKNKFKKKNQNGLFLNLELVPIFSPKKTVESFFIIFHIISGSGETNEFWFGKTFDFSKNKKFFFCPLSTEIRTTIVIITCCSET